MKKILPDFVIDYIVDHIYGVEHKACMRLILNGEEEYVIADRICYSLRQTQRIRAKCWPEACTNIAVERAGGALWQQEVLSHIGKYFDRMIMKHFIQDSFTKEEIAYHCGIPLWHVRNIIAKAWREACIEMACESLGVII